MLERTWRMAAMRASGVTLLVPIGLALGIALTVSLGGNVNGLTQVVAGPSVPTAAERQLDASTGSVSGPILPAIPRAREDRRSERASSQRRSPERTGRSPRREAPQARTPEREPRDTTPSAPTTPSQPAPATTPAAPPAPAPEEPADPSAPAPSRPSDPVRDLGTGIANTVGEVPLVGPPVAGVVQTVVDLLAPPR